MPAQPATTESDLLTTARAGDETAFGRLVGLVPKIPPRRATRTPPARGQSSESRCACVSTSGPVRLGSPSRGSRVTLRLG